MLICNNCNTVNEDSARKCIHCQMTGNFRHQMGENKSDSAPVIQLKVVCRNCGSNEPGEGSKCMHCRFPLAGVRSPEVREEAKKTESPSTIYSTEKQV